MPNFHSWSQEEGGMLFMVAEGHKSCSLSFIIVMNLSIKSPSFSSPWSASKLGAAHRENVGRAWCLDGPAFPRIMLQTPPAWAAASRASLRAAFLHGRC